MNLRIGLLICALLALWFMPVGARAETTCSAVASDIVISGYDGTATATATGTVTVTCGTALDRGGYVQVEMCLYIDGNPRQLINGPSSLNYNLYTSGGTVWQGPTSAVLAQQSLSLSYKARESTTQQISIEARIPVQPGATSGTYSQVLSGITTSGEFRFYEPTTGSPYYPSNCKSGGNGGGTVAPFPFTVKAPVSTRCQINTASDLNFGSVDGLFTAPVNQTSQISLKCVGGTAWQLGLSNGVNASGTQRRMKDSDGNFVTYELYRNASRSARWGNTLNTDTVSGSGTGNDQNITVFGQLPVQTATPGDYSDTITVTLTY